jgi:curved DNA-binding protein CbpA
MPEGFGAGGRRRPSFAEFSKQFPNGYTPDFDFNKPPPNFNNKAPPEGFGDWFSDYMKDHKDEFKKKYGNGRQEGMPEPPRPKVKPKRNLYQILDLTPRATQENIKKSFRKLAREFHPDKHKGSKKKEMEEKFVELANAYEILSDVKKRRRYDMGGPNAMGDMGPDDINGEEWDDFGGFSSFEEAWGAHGGGKVFGSQPIMSDTLSNWVLVFVMGSFLVIPVAISYGRSKNKAKKAKKACVCLQNIAKLCKRQGETSLHGWKRFINTLLRPYDEDIWAVAARIEAKSKLKKKIKGKKPKNAEKKLQNRTKSGKRMEHEGSATTSSTISTKSLHQYGHSSEKLLNEKLIANAVKANKAIVSDADAALFLGEESGEADYSEVDSGWTEQEQEDSSATTAYYYDSSPPRRRKRSKRKGLPTKKHRKNNTVLCNCRCDSWFCIFIKCSCCCCCCFNRYSCQCVHDIPEDEDGEEEYLPVKERSIEKKKTMGRGGGKTPSKAKQFKSFMANRWWAQYSRVFVCMGFVGVLMFSLTVFLGLKKSSEIKFLNVAAEDKAVGVELRRILVPDHSSRNTSYVVLCQSSETGSELNKMWQKIVLGINDHGIAVDEDESEGAGVLKGAVIDCKATFSKSVAIALFSGSEPGPRLTHQPDLEPLQGESVEELLVDFIDFSAEEGKAVAFVTSYKRRPVLIPSNLLNEADIDSNFDKAMDFVELASNINPRLHTIKNQDMFEKYCLTTNVAFCGLILKKENGPLQDDIKNILRHLARDSFSFLNFAQVNLKKYELSIENKLPKQDSDTNAPHFVLVHTSTRTSDEGKKKVAARALRGFFTEDNLDHFIKTTIEKVEDSEQATKYLSQELVVSKRSKSKKKKPTKKKKGSSHRPKASSRRKTKKAKPERSRRKKREKKKDADKKHVENENEPIQERANRDEEEEDAIDIDKIPEGSPTEDTKPFSADTEDFVRVNLDHQWGEDWKNFAAGDNL